nr:unnamed protein product [Callosobruchus analis]
MSESEEESTNSADWTVTEEWLLTVLKEHHKEPEDSDAISISDYTVTPGCESDPDGTSHNLDFIIKLLPQDAFSRFFVTEAQFDLREIKFYTQVVPDIESFKKNTDETIDLRLPIPRCYYAHYSAGSTEPEPTPPESVLVLENMKPQGYVGADFSRGLTLRQATAAVEAVSVLHALSLSLKVERGLPQLSRFLESSSGLESVLIALEDLRPYTKDIIENLLAPEEPMALITHTDFWCNNLMFREDENSCTCAVLDWQMVTYSKATNDLALLLISSVPAELRRLHTDSLLDHYWENFTASCRTLKLDVEAELGYDRKKLAEDYKRSQLLALLLCIGSVDLALGNAQMEERLLELLKDLHEGGLLNADLAKKVQE